MLKENVVKQGKLFCCIQNRADGPTYNVIDAWNSNITGKGVVVAVVDEGFDPQHPEIYDNYLQVSQYILNSAKV